MSSAACRALVCIGIASVVSVPAMGDVDAIEEFRTCRDHRIAEMRSKQVTDLPDPRRSGAILQIELPASIATVRSAGGHRYRRRVWFTLYLTTHEAVDAAWPKLDAVRAALAEGLTTSMFEDMCTIAGEHALTLSLQDRVRDVLGDRQAFLRVSISGDRRLD